MIPDPSSPIPRYSVWMTQERPSANEDGNWCMWADVKARLAQLAQEQATLRSERDAMQRRAEAAEEDWQAAEAALGETRQALQQLTEKHETLLSRVGGECLSDRQDLPRKPPTGEPIAAKRTE